VTHSSSIARRRFSRFLGVMIAAVSLSACGFTPLYGDHSTAASPDVVDALATVAIRPLPNREGVKLHQALREGLQPRGVTRAVYDLEVNLATRVEELGIRPDATSSRANLILLATFKLNEGGTAIYGDRSYNILDDQFATVAAQADAENRGIKQIGEEIKTRLAVYFHEHAKVASAAKP